MFCNYAMSLDGKISTRDRLGSSFSSREDRRRMDIIRARADVIVVGAETVRRDNPPFQIRQPDLIRQRQHEGRPPHPALCVLTRSGRLPENLAVFHQQFQPVLIAAAGSFHPPAGHSATVRILPLQQPQPAVELRNYLHGAGFSQILLEGGGTLNALFWEAALVTEVYLTLCPVILGGAGAPTPVEGTGFAGSRWPRLRLLSAEPENSELFLHYEVVSTPVTS